MSKTPPTLRAARIAIAAAALAATAAAHAVVGAPSSSDATGAMKNLAYGTTGNVFDLIPMLFVSGLGSANNPPAVVGLNPALAFDVSMSGTGTSLVQVQYQIANNSATDSFSQVRLMAFANPDGEQSTFLDRVAETWGAAAAADPAKREVQAFQDDPTNSIVGRFRTNGTLTDGGPAGACAAASGCDATAALEWLAPTLGPQERFVVTVGLSDNGQALSGRFLTASGVGSPGTVLTLSGTGVVLAVPEPATWALWLAGVLGVGGAARRRCR